MSEKKVGPIILRFPVNPLPPRSEFTLKRNRVKKNENNPRQPLETVCKENMNSETNNLNYKKDKKVLRRSREVVAPRLKSPPKLSGKRNIKRSLKRPHGRDLKGISSAANDYKGGEKHRRRLVFTDRFDSKSQPDDKVVAPRLKSPPKLSGKRNIKRSLKRPHGRDLKGISSAANDDKGDEKHRRRLVFTDRFDSKSQPDDLVVNSYASSYNQDYGPELFDYLIKREETPKVPNISTSKRAGIMNWLVKVNGPRGNPAAVQTAAWYFDNLISVAEIDVNKLQLVAAASYWIASKLHHRHFVSAKKLVRIGGNAYSAKHLKFAEKAVLSKLAFPIQPVVAQDFITYLSWVCDPNNFVEIETAATLSYMAGLVVYETLNVYPSSVAAAAAICNALNLLKKTELLTKLAKNAVYEAAKKKQADFDTICYKQIIALCKMMFPSFKYRALLENMKINKLANKVLASVKDLVECPNFSRILNFI